MLLFLINTKLYTFYTQIYMEGISNILNYNYILQE